MNFLGPIGLTLAVAWLFRKIVIRISSEDSESVIISGFTPNSLASRLARGIDYRFILLGALIPDLIDKPLVFLVDPEFVNSSLRSVGHSFIGGMVLLGVVWIATRGWHGMPTASFAIALSAHLSFDRIWEMPEVLEWPARGWVLPMQDIPFSHWYRVHFSQLPTTAPDFIGIALVAIFVGYMIWSRSITAFVKTGQRSE